MSLPWFRMYHEFASDPVVQCLAFEDQRHFVMLLCFKCSGLLDREFGDPETRLNVIRKALGLDGKAWDEMRSRLCAVTLIDENLQPVRWSARQYSSDADPTATERKRKQRLREKDRHARVTRDSRPSDTDTDTDTEKTGEGARKRATRRCPRDFEVTPEMREWARTECPGVDVDAGTAKFRDHTYATARIDWLATWRNWMRNEKPRPGAVIPMKPKPAPTPEQISEAQRRAAEENIKQLAKLGLRP